MLLELMVVMDNFMSATAEIHPDTARKYGIGDGDMIIVETKRGSIEVRAQVTEDIAPQVLRVPHGWTHANVNILTDETPACPVPGTPSIKALLCKVRRS